MLVVARQIKGFFLHIKKAFFKLKYVEEWNIDFYFSCK